MTRPAQSPRTLAEIAESLGASLLGDPSVTVTGLAHPDDAGAGDLALALGPAYLDALRASIARAAVLIAPADLAELGLDGAIVVARGRLAMAGLTRMLDPSADMAPGLHPTVLAAEATLADDACIGPYAVIGTRTRIGAGARIGPHVVIGSDCEIGDGALIHAGVRIGHRVVIGARFIAQPGAVIGADGFSYVTERPHTVETARRARAQVPPEPPQPWQRIHSLGGIRIGDDVEIGANSTIDAGTVRPTTIGSGTKIDNLVHVGHNAQVGRDCLLCGCVGIAGSVVIGDRVVMGGAAGATDNLSIGDDAIIGAGSILSADLPAGRFVTGTPPIRTEEYLRQYRALRRLPRLAQAVADLQKALSKPTRSD